MKRKDFFRTFGLAAGAAVAAPAIAHNLLKEEPTSVIDRWKQKVKDRDKRYMGNILWVKTFNEETFGPYAKDGERVIDEIKDQGGLAVLAHPFKRNKNLNAEIIKNMDAVEVFNARSAKTNMAARKLAIDYGYPVTAGSDSHFCFEVGRGRIVVQNAFDAESVRKAILKKQIEIKGLESRSHLDLLSQFLRIVKQKRYKKIPGKLYERFNYGSK